MAIREEVRDRLREVPARTPGRGVPAREMRENTFHDGAAKFRELILYVAQESEGDPSFGATKLNKILFYADLIAYGNSGQTISGQTYQRLTWGPAPRALVPVRDEMVNRGDCAIKAATFHGRRQNRLMALREPNLTLFNGSEIDTVRAVIEGFRDHSGADASELSHQYEGWKCVEEKETIPFEMVFLEDRELTQTERDFASKLEAACVQED